MGHEHRASVDDSAIKSTRKTQVKRFVEARLQDSDLAVGSIALSMQISARHLHRIFSDEEEGLGEYILRRRLEECARRFRTPLWQSRTITEIAMDWGFSSMAHFSRAFKARFGVSPTDFRRAHAPSKKKYNDVSTASGGLSNGLILRALSRNN